MRFFARPIEEYFSEIYGLEHVKRILIDACKTRESVAILLWGPPQSAKTLMLEAIARYFNFNNGIPFMLDRATPAGLAELFSQRYSVYVFDEIDKAKAETLRVFNEAVEHKRVSFIKHKTSIVVRLPQNTKFFVGANSLSILKEKVPETVTRFLDIPLPPMTYDYFREIVYLQLRKYGYERRDSDTIAGFAWRCGLRDVRKIRELGKIYPNNKTSEILRFISYWANTRAQLAQSNTTGQPAARFSPESLEDFRKRLEKARRILSGNSDRTSWR